MTLLSFAEAEDLEATVKEYNRRADHYIKGGYAKITSSTYIQEGKPAAKKNK